MKAILISDHPKWCAKMMNGEKKIEVRKGTALYKATQKLIEENGYTEFYVYCTKGKPNLWLPYEYDCFELDEASQPYLSDKPIDTKMNGKVIFKFRCYNVEELSIKYGVGWQTKTIKGKEQVEKLTRLSVSQLFEYCGRKTSTAIHISDLEIFDRPKELGEFSGSSKKIVDCNKCPYFNACEKDDYITVRNGVCYVPPVPLTKSPQSWQFIEVKE